MIMPWRCSFTSSETCFRLRLRLRDFIPTSSRVVLLAPSHTTIRSQGFSWPSSTKTNLSKLSSTLLQQGAGLSTAIIPGCFSTILRRNSSNFLVRTMPTAGTLRDSLQHSFDTTQLPGRGRFLSLCAYAPSGYLKVLSDRNLDPLLIGDTSLKNSFDISSSILDR